MGLAQGHRLRIGRYSEADRIYLITTVTYSRRPLFADLYLARLVIDTIHRAYDQADTLCYCLMPDHLHWLVQLKDRVELPVLVQRMKSVSAHRIRTASSQPHYRVLQRGFHDRALRRNEDLPSVGRYVVANPLRAGLVRRLGAYPHWDAVWLG